MSANVGCFLCEAPSELNYYADSRGLAVSGLGPIVPDYSVVAATAHVRSGADSLSEFGPDFLEFAAHIRQQLILRHGSCLLTEHGRMPVCGDTVAGERHCYHAHFLLFPGAPSIVDRALTFFKNVHETASLSQALRYARSQTEYFLVSPATDSFLVLSDHTSVPRQLARLLVATALGDPEKAIWQKHPNRELAARYAMSLRKLFGEEGKSDRRD